MIKPAPKADYMEMPTEAPWPASPDQLARDVETALQTFETHARQLGDRGERVLGARVLAVDPHPSLGLLLLLSCAGADVSVLSSGPVEWNPHYHPKFFLTLLRRMRSEGGAFDPDPVIHVLLNDGLLPELPRRLSHAELSRPLGHNGFDVVVCGQSAPLEAESIARLAAVTREGGLFLYETAQDSLGEAQCDELHVAENFGGWLALTKDTRTFTEHPTEEDSPQTLAHCLARYAFVREFVADKRVLDVGCGAGIGTRALLEAGPTHVDAIDVNQEALDLARQKTTGAATFHQADLEQGLKDFGDSKYDVVVCLEVLEHVENQSQLIADIHRVLAADGLAIVSVPYEPFETFWAELVGEDNPFHFHVPTIAEFRELLAAFDGVELMAQADLVTSVVLPLGGGEQAPLSTEIAVKGPGSITPCERGTITVIGVCSKGKPAAISPTLTRHGRAYGDHQDTLGAEKAHARDLLAQCAKLKVDAFNERNRGKWERLKSREFLLAPRNMLRRVSRQGVGGAVGSLLGASRAWLSNQRDTPS